MKKGLRKLLGLLLVSIFLSSFFAGTLYGKVKPIGGDDGGGGGCTGGCSASVTCGIPPYVRQGSCSVSGCCGVAECYPTIRCAYCYCNDVKVSQGCC